MIKAKFTRFFSIVAALAFTTSALFAGEVSIKADLERDIAFGYQSSEGIESIRLKVGPWESPPNSGEKYVRIGNSFNCKAIFLMVRFDISALAGKRVSWASLILSQTDITHGDHDVEIALFPGQQKDGEWILDEAALSTQKPIDVLKTSLVRNGKVLQVDVSRAVKEAVKNGQSFFALQIRDLTANSKPEDEDYIDFSPEVLLDLSVSP